jgi:hypothetical protein
VTSELAAPPRPASEGTQIFRLRPRYRGVAALAIGAGGVLGLAGAVAGATSAIVAGAAGVVLGAAYLASPVWRVRVQVDGEGLEVVGRFRLRWAEVRRVLASPTTSTCFVDGGSPARSLLIPGDGAPAPYTLDDRVGAYRAIMARVPRDVVIEVARLAESAAALTPVAAAGASTGTVARTDAETETETESESESVTDSETETESESETESDASATAAAPRS